MINKRLLIVPLGLVLFCYNAFPQTNEARLISTDAFITELLFALGADKDLVAIDVTSRLPQNYRKLANIGYHRTLSAEGLLSLQPTKVIGSELMGPQGTLLALKKANIELIQIPPPMTLAELRKTIGYFAQILDRQQKGKQLIERIDRQAHKLEAQNLAQRRIAFLLSMEPNKPRLAGANTSGSALISLLRGINVASFNNYRNVSSESLLALHPDVIIVAGRQQSRAVDELLTAHPVLKHTPAAKNGNILSVDSNALVAGLSITALEQALSIIEKLPSNTP